MEFSQVQTYACSQPLRVHDAPAADAGSDDQLVIPRTIREWRTTPSGRSLECSAIMVWSYLYTRTGAGSLPVTTPCTLRQLTEWLGRKDRSSASNALGRLIEEGLCEIVHSIVAPTEATLSGYSTTKRSVTWRLSDQTRRPKSSFLTIATRDDDVANSQQLVASLPHHQTGRCPPGLLPELRDEIA